MALARLTHQIFQSVMVKSSWVIINLSILKAKISNYSYAQ